MRMKKTLRALAVLPLLLTFCTEAVTADVLSGERIKLSDSPRWVFSGAWDAGDEHLLLVDVLQSKVLRYGPDGRLEAGPPADAALPNPAFLQRASPTALWLEHNDGQLFELGPDLQARPLVNLLEKARTAREALISVFGWVPLSESELLVFGDLRRGNGGVGAVLRIPLQDPSKFEILREVPLDTPAHRSFLIGMPFLAGVQGQPYILMTTDTPQILKPDGSGFRIVQVTAAGRREPYGRLELPAKVTMDTTAQLFKQLERSTSAAGLYGWRGFLYMLKRKPAGDGQTLWSLLKIDPKTNKILWTRRIDTSANHLLVVPGEKYWAFVEKGPVKGPGNQEISSYLRIPAEAIEAP